MLTRTRALVLAFLLMLPIGLSARVHRGRPHIDKIFSANSQSVLLENEAGEAMGAFRYFTQAQVDKAVQEGILVPLRTPVSPKLPPERRYALPGTVDFVERLDHDFYEAFHKHLMVDSAIRPATVQRGLHLRNAASAYGLKASSHERGCTVDISKRLTRVQQQWLVIRLLYYHALGRVLVIQERACYHVFIKGDL